MRTALRAMVMVLSLFLSLSAQAAALSFEQVSAWLRSGEYDALDRALQELQIQFEGDTAHDDWMIESFKRFSDLPDSTDADERALDAWVERYPTSYAARVARGIFRINQGHTRLPSGNACISPEARDQSMAAGREDLVAALELSEAPLAAHVWLMHAETQSKRSEQMWKYFQAAARYAPGSMELHQRAMNSLVPSRGGSIVAMERFAREREPIVGPGLVTNMLWGHVYYERVHPLLEKAEFNTAHEMLSEGLTRYGSRRLYCARAYTRLRLDRWQEALTDMQAAIDGMTAHGYCEEVAVRLARDLEDRPGVVEMLDGVIAANPDSMQLHQMRGWLLDKRGDHVAALPDLTFAMNEGDPWSRAKVAGYYFLGRANLPKDFTRSAAMYREAAEQGDDRAQWSLVEALLKLGRTQEAARERARYQVSEIARVRSSARDEGLPFGEGWLRHAMDPRWQALGLAALAVMWILYRGRSNIKSVDPGGL